MKTFVLLTDIGDIVHFNCIVQFSLYHNMDIGTMRYCALVSSSPSQFIGLVLGCVFFLVLSVVRCPYYYFCDRIIFHHYFHHDTVYPKKYAHGFVVRCFVVVMQSFIMNSHEVFIHIHRRYFSGTGAIVRLPQCQ